MLVSSPHAWGCFYLQCNHRPANRVFPTRVGVFPCRSAPRSRASRLPHTRGGVSVISALFQRRPPSSPHAWGVSPVVVVLGNVLESSPHAWGCFYRAESQPDGIIVFPTRVGCFSCMVRILQSHHVFPTRGGVSTSRRPRRAITCLPHTRGGVSLQLAVELTDAGSSPHVWGCFFITCERIWLYPVFPTCVEVFSPFK